MATEHTAWIQPKGGRPAVVKVARLPDGDVGIEVNVRMSMDDFAEFLGGLRDLTARFHKVKPDGRHG